LPPVKQNLGTVEDPFPIRRGLQTPLVIAAPRSITDLGPSDDFSTLMIDSYLLTCKYSNTASHLARLWIHGVFLPESTRSSNPIPSACSVARRWLLESLNSLHDLTNRVVNIIGRGLAHNSRWTANATRTHHPTAPTSYDTTPLPIDLLTGFHEIRLDISTSCVAVGLIYQLASRQRELRSAGPAPTSAASSPSLLAKLR
jgi:hypothetical protein